MTRCSVALQASPAGGWLEGGPRGEYFANPDFAGAPAFTRRDVRIDFDWGRDGLPGGSRAPGFRDVGSDGYSVRWTGRLASRTSGAHGLRVEADDGARLAIQGPDEATFRTVIDALAAGGSHESTVELRAGEPYTVQLEYREVSGPARVRMSWRGPGFDEEVVDTASLAALNVDTYGAELWANAMDGARDEWRDPGFGGDESRWPARDERGWPRADGGIIVWEGAEPAAMAGRYRLSFRGRARVSAQGTAATFFVAGQRIGNALPSGTGWDAASNITTAEVDIVPVDILYLYFRETRRQASDATPTGVTEVRLMRPRTAGGAVPQPDGARFDGWFREAVGRYQALRWISNFETERTWADRVRPGYATHREVGTRRHWELMVQLANETGKDLYACLPHRADDDYVRRVARLIRFGSDGAEPYAGPEANPVHPPLNPNLRVYLERGNELWNWSFAQASESAGDGQREVQGGTVNGRILNFDGRNAAGDHFYRWHALRSLQMSEVFRAVWGDEAMGTRVRFLLEYQYDNAQGTAESALDFLDRYFNNGDGVAHVPVPHPVRHFFWGGGGATYYGAGNSQGTQREVEVPNGDFEAPVLPPGTAVEAPVGSGWTFHGTAGLFSRADTETPVGAGSLPPSPSGRQALWLAGTGAVSRVVVFPRPGTYALRFLAATPERENGVRFFVDDRNITPDGESFRGPSDAHWLPGFGWNRNPRRFENNGSYTFAISNAGPRTLRLVASGLPRYFNPFEARPETNRWIGFDRLELVSLDALFGGGIPASGEANGQPSELASGHETSIWSQARYAQAYGLQVVAYEGGWSLGGDFGAVPIQNVAKFLDPRASATAEASMDIFARSGGALYTWGTYTTWPRYETPSSGDFPLTRGVDAHGRRLPPEPRNGLHVPNMLTPANVRWSLGMDANGGDAVLREPGAWMGWNVLVPATARYEVVLRVSGGTNPSAARVALQRDGEDVGESRGSGVSTQVVALSKGLHSLRVQSRGGQPAVSGLELRLPGTPGAPRILAAEDGDGTLALRWAPGDGPAPEGYLLRHGTQPGTYLHEIDLGSLTNWTFSGLANHVPYFVEIVARNAVGQGPPAPEASVVPFPIGETGALATFEFGGLAGNEVSATARSASSRIEISTLRRGAGLLPTTYTGFVRNTFGSVSANNFYAQSLEESVRRNQSYQLRIAPRPPLRLALERVRFRPYFQNVTGRPGDPRGAGIAWSTNGTDFVARLVPGTPTYSGTSEFDADLSAEAGLRDVAGPVWVRVHLFGNGPYEFTGLGGPGDDLVIVGRLLGREPAAVPVLVLTWRPDVAGAWRIETPSSSEATYRLWRSTDLRDWEVVETLDGTGGTLGFGIRLEPGRAAMFWQLSAAWRD